MLKFNKKGQNTAEYAILIGLVVAAAIAMQTYVKRAMQGGVKFAVDKLESTDENITTHSQYEPYYLESSYDVTQQAYTETEETRADGWVERAIEGEKTTVRSGSQTIKGVDEAN